jgi:hypothetical protein
MLGRRFATCVRVCTLNGQGADSSMASMGSSTADPGNTIAARVMSFQNQAYIDILRMHLDDAEDTRLYA